MSRDHTERDAFWRRVSETIVARMAEEGPVAFITLGDPMLYSTAVYLLRQMEQVQPLAKVEVIPGVPALCAAASLAQTPIGFENRRLTIMSGETARVMLPQAVHDGDGVVIMKVGNRLGDLAALLQQEGVSHRSVYIARAGLPGERVIHGLDHLDDEALKETYMATILVYPELAP